MNFITENPRLPIIGRIIRTCSEVISYNFELSYRVEANSICSLGLDLSVKPHGTWLAASKKGKIGVLLNIQERENSSQVVESRGTLVTNYVKGDVRADEYIRNILDSTTKYNGYHLLLFTLT